MSPAPGCIEYEKGIFTNPPIGGCFGKTTIEHFTYDGPTCISVYPPTSCTGGKTGVQNNCESYLVLEELNIEPGQIAYFKAIMKDGKVVLVYNPTNDSAPYPEKETAIVIQGMANGESVKIQYTESGKYC
jgi:hypothetical protein